MRKYFWIISLLLKLQILSANDGYIRKINADVLHYDFYLTLNDSTNRVEGRAVIQIRFLMVADSLKLDLKSVDISGKGMNVIRASQGIEGVKWKQESETLTLFFTNRVQTNDTLDFTISYSGIPADGLIISKNKFGNRTFFADHWPNRAHDYLPCIDHPYDKASVDFIITAPDRYKVVASGELVEESDLPGPNKLTHWSESVPLSTKIITFAAAEFAVKSAGKVNNIPVWSWVFPENRLEGFSDYAVAVKPLEYYSRIIGNYPFTKLANVQSKTIYGGLENAGTIFYSERSVTGLGNAEALIAHEIAHQWFGDCVTESDWFHVWLSEGFATYLTSMYFESFQGRKRLESDMSTARSRVLNYYEKSKKPVIDTTITDLMNLLNANSYQKGAWVLHMLRYEIGDQDFMKGLQLFYNRFYNSNVLTEDFKHVMEEISSKNLDQFFKQWLYTAGQPELSITHLKGKQKGMTDVFVEQKQESLYEFNLELLLKDSSGERVVKTAVKNRITRISIPAGYDLVITPDPNVNLLFK
jgi:aminopeptidase N